MSKNSIPKKIIASKLLKLKMGLLTEHSAMMFQHMSIEYMRQRAKEEILSGGDLSLAQNLLLMADVKAEQEINRESAHSKK